MQVLLVEQLQVALKARGYSMSRAEPVSAYCIYLCPLLSAPDSRPAKQRASAVQGMLVHPGWNALIPCEASVHDVYLALESGQADLRVDVTGSQGQQITSLRELMAIPSHEHGPMLREIIMRVVNAQHLKTATGDVCHQNMLRNIGEAHACTALCSKESDFGGERPAS